IADDHADDELAEHGGLPGEAGETPPHRGGQHHHGQLQQEGRERIGVTAFASRGLREAAGKEREEDAAEPDRPAAPDHARSASSAPTSAAPGVRAVKPLGTGLPASVKALRIAATLGPKMVLRLERHQALEPATVSSEPWKRGIT